MEAATDHEKFSDPNLSVHDNDELLARLATYLFVLQKKVATCNNKLSKLHNSLDEVANDVDKEWSIDYPTKELGN